MPQKRRILAIFMRLNKNNYDHSNQKGGTNIFSRPSIAKSENNLEIYHIMVYIWSLENIKQLFEVKSYDVMIYSVDISYIPQGKSDSLKTVTPFL